MDQFVQLAEALAGAASQDPSLVKAAEARLASWENQPGFYAALIKFAGSLQFNTNTRFMAVLYLKNGVERTWRRGMSSIPEPEKIHIRQGLQGLILTEPVLSIATQLSVTIGKIGRLDVPKEWPELLPMLLESVRLVDPDRQHRALLGLHALVKALSTKRLTGDRKLFQDIASQIFDYLTSLWDTLYSNWAGSGASGESLQRAHLTLKILRVLTIRGYKVPGESPSVGKFIPVVMQRAKEALELRTSRQDNSTLLQKHITTMWKIIYDLLETHPLSFVPFVQPALEFAAYFGFGQGRPLCFERVLLHSLNLLKGIVLCPEFIGPKTDLGLTTTSTKAPLTSPLTFQAAAVKRAFFSDPTLEVMIRLLVTTYLPLTQAELDSWQDDPEEFALRSEDAGESWKYSMRQSAEVLLITLFKEFRKSVDILLAILNEFLTPLTDLSDHATVLAKDSLYNATGITAYELYDEFSFDTWLHSTLIHEVSVPILHRRITWLVGQWTGVKLAAESRPTVFRLLLGGLKCSDVVVRLTASQAFKSVLDDFDFSPEQFTPFLQDVFFSLLTLLKDVRESDNKMRVLHTMSFVIERMSAHIKSTIQLQDLTIYLPMLWASEHNMLKAGVVAICIHLVHALGSDSFALKDFLFPVIRISTDLKSAEHVYLLEDGLELWLALMEYMPEPPDSCLISLVQNLPPLLSASTEHLKSTLSLVNSYCLIYPESFAEQFGSGICQELSDAVKDMRAEGTAMALRSVENLLRTSPRNGPRAVRALLPKVFLSLYERMDTPILQSLYLCIAARLLLISEPVFQSGLELLASRESSSTPAMLGAFTDIICEKLPDIVQSERKKLLCIGLLKLLSSGEEVILHRTCGVFLSVSETLNDIVKADLNGKASDSLFLLVLNKGGPESESSPNDIRKRQLSSRDVVYSVDLVQLFRSEVSNLRNRLGPVKFAEIVSTVDVETMAMAKAWLE